MRRLVALLVVLSGGVAWARDPVKCGRAIVARAERLQARGATTLRIPRGCGLVRWPPGYGTLSADGQVDLYGHGRRLARFRQPRRTRQTPASVTAALRQAGLDVYEGQ